MEYELTEERTAMNQDSETDEVQCTPEEMAEMLNGCLGIDFAQQPNIETDFYPDKNGQTAVLVVHDLGKKAYHLHFGDAYTGDWHADLSQLCFLVHQAKEKARVNAAIKGGTIVLPGDKEV